MRSVRLALPVLLAVLISAGSASADPLTLRVVNQRGIPQFTGFSTDAVNWFASDPYGNAALNVSAGQTVSVSRDPNPNNPVPPPEGAAGVSHTVTPDDLAVGTLTLTVPDAATPAYQPTLSDAERWLVGKLNEDRTAHALPALKISTTLTAAADAIARYIALKRVGDPYYPFSPPFRTVVLQDWGWPTSGGGGLDAGGGHPSGALAHWTDGSPREDLLLNANVNAIGIGDGDGTWVAQLATCPSQGSDRCQLTQDTGDPNIVLPPPPSGSGTGTAGGGTAGGGTAGGGTAGGGTAGGGTAGGGTGPTDPKGATAPRFRGKTSQKLGISFELTGAGLAQLKVRIFLPRACGGGIPTFAVASVKLNKNQHFTVSKRLKGLRFSVSGTISGAKASGNLSYAPRRRKGKPRRKSTCQSARFTWTAAAN